MSGAEPPPLLGRDDPVPRRHWVWLAPTLVVLVLVAAAAAFFAASRVEPGVPGPERVSELFLQAVAADDLRMSYGLLCERRRREVDALQFRETVIDHRDAVARALESGRRSTSRNVNKPKERVVLYRYSDRGSIHLVLEREPKRWAVCSLEVLDRDAG